MSIQPSLAVGTVILDEVLSAIACALTSRAPERGGLLFGPRGQKLVTLFVADEEAAHHYGTYTPSAEICRRSPEIERNHGLEYKGLIHSHPGSMDHPSGPDIDNARRALGTNPHLSYFMMPIVTLGEFDASELGSHELLLSGGKLSHWIVPQAVSADARQLCEERVTALTLWSDLRKLAKLLPGHPEVARSSMLDIEGVSAAAYLLDLEQGTWMFAAAAGYPFTPPLVVPPAGDRSAVALIWDLEIAAEQRFHAAVAPLMNGGVIDVVEPPAELVCKANPLARKRRRTNRKLLGLCALLALSSAVGSFIGGIAAQGRSSGISETGISSRIHTTANSAVGNLSVRTHTRSGEHPEAILSNFVTSARVQHSRPGGDNPLMEFFRVQPTPDETSEKRNLMIWNFQTTHSLKPSVRP